MNRKKIIILVVLIALVGCVIFTFLVSRKNTNTKEQKNEEIQEPLKTYLNAVYLYANGELEKSYNQFNKIIEYKDSSEYLLKINQLEELNILGLWYNWFNADMGLYIDITPTTCYMYVKEKDKLINNQEPLIFDDKNFKCGDYSFIPTTQKYVSSTDVDKNGNLVAEYEERIEYIVQYNSDNQKDIFNGRQFGKSKKYLSYEPQLNMTKDKVALSTWLKPKETISNTYSWGIKEQWIYDNGVINFENGIVTGINTE